MKYTTILFDLDDTLLDFSKAEDAAVTKIMKKYNVPQTKENKELYINMNKAKWTALENGEITRDILFGTRFGEYFKAVGVDGDGIAANEEYISYLAQGHFLIDGALDVCKKLSSDYKLYIITNGAKKAQNGRLSNSPIMEFISDVFISEEIGADKPDKRFFDYVCNHIDEKDKSKLLIVGDSLYSDIAGGVQYGIDTCWINKNSTQNSDATYTICSVIDLLKLLYT